MSSKLESFLFRNNVDHKINHGWIQFPCPFCDDTHRHAAFSPTGACTCFKCGKLKPVKTLMALAKCSFEDAVSALNLHHKDFDSEVERKAVEFTWPSRTIDIEESHYEYLKGRRIKNSVIKEFGLRATNHLSLIPHSIVIPVRKDGRNVSWTTRSILPSAEIRYLTCPKEKEVESIKDCLLGWEFTGSKVILVEGPFDALRIGKGAVAAFGKVLSKEQIKMLQTKSMVFVCMDKGEHTTMSKMSMQLYPCRVNNIYLDAKDAGEADEEEIQELRNLIK